MYLKCSPLHLFAKKQFQHNIQEDYVQRHKFQWAVCLPDTCEHEDVQKIVNDALVPELNRQGMEGDVTIDPLLHTSSQNIYKYTAGFYLTWYFRKIYLLLTIVSHDLSCYFL